MQKLATGRACVILSQLTLPETISRRAGVVITLMFFFSFFPSRYLVNLLCWVGLTFAQTLLAKLLPRLVLYLDQGIYVTDTYCLIMCI